MIITNDNVIYDFFPESIEKEIKQNIIVILSTIQGTVVLNRKLGLDISFIDTPANIGLITCKAKILQAIAEREPRVEVLEIRFIDGEIENGNFRIEVEVEILDEYK